MCLKKFEQCLELIKGPLFTFNVIYCYSKFFLRCHRHLASIFLNTSFSWSENIRLRTLSFPSSHYSLHRQSRVKLLFNQHPSFERASLAVQLVKNLQVSSIPGLGRSLGEGNGYPLQYSGLENSRDCIVQGIAESDTTEQLLLSLERPRNAALEEMNESVDCIFKTTQVIGKACVTMNPSSFSLRPQMITPVPGTCFNPGWL